MNAFWFTRLYFIDRSLIVTVPDHHQLDFIHSDIVSDSVYARSRVTVAGLQVELVCSKEKATPFLYIFTYH